ncbi:helix-turn-helix domain-containing protein [bacterium]|nr:helix-turn-helix domain-containing protein [bacterium]MBP9809676.1 helix-turn-helix domain-containing protein [bacterium]
MSLEQIGQKLKVAREGQSLSVGQVYDRTKIPVNHIDALESGRLDDLPEPVYVAGFIKRYGDMLGLNGQSLADEYKRAGQPVVENGRGLFHRGGGVQQAVAPLVYVSKPRVETEAPSFTKTFFYPGLLLIAVLGVVCGLSTWHQAQLNTQDPGLLALGRSAERFNPAQLPATGVATAVNGTVPNGTNSTAVPATDNKIALSASQHVWVEVKSVASGQSLFTGYLEMGERRDFQDVQGLRVRAGNGGSLTVDYQGKSEAFGLPGKIAERVFASAPVTAAGNDSASVTATGDAATKPAVTTVKWKAPVRRTATDGSVSQGRRPRRSDEGTRDIPGVSSGGGTRSIDVPYRYNDGRLDND